jgi:hypothetical protein
MKIVIYIGIIILLKIYNYNITMLYILCLFINYIGTLI